MAGSQLAGPAADVSKTLYGESRKLYVEPKRTVQYLQTVTIRHCQMLYLGSPGPDEAILTTWQELRSANRSYRTVRLGPGTICDFHHTKF